MKRTLATLMTILALSGALPLLAIAQEEHTQMKTIYFAGGCFWGLEKLMGLVPGVQDAQSGYANGHKANPTYEEVCRGDTGHREAVRVTYDPAIMGLNDLMRLFYSVIDPTVRDRQAHDIGSQYQTGIYWAEEADRDAVLAYAEQEKGKHSAFYVELGPLTAFWPAEDYHQDYLDKNPQGYCHIGLDAFDRARQLTRQDD